MSNSSAYKISGAQSFQLLRSAISLIFSLGMLFAAGAFLFISLTHGYFFKPLCFSYECVSGYFSSLGPVFSILSATLGVAVSIATLLGIFIALLSYLNASDTAALSNHIAHLKIFMDYVESEIRRFDRLSIENFDTLLLYGTIFDQSRSGKMAASDQYKRLINELNGIIDESNNVVPTGVRGGFNYTQHQNKVKALLATAGIDVKPAPRNDYFAMEGQLFLLLQRVSQSFCAPNEIPVIIAREYS